MRLQKLIADHRAMWMAPGELDDQQRKSFHAAEICRTGDAGGSLYACEDCPQLEYRYHSCGNRFCPACQNHLSTRWLERQKSRLLKGETFMLTVTLPKQLRNVPRYRLAEFYKIFFDCASAAIKELIADRLGGECGFFGVLHTHARNLDYHPHIHFVIPGLVINKKEQTCETITSGFLLKTKPLAKLFRGKILQALADENFSFPGYLYAKEWVIHCKSVGSGEHACEYLSRYLFRGVISESKLKLEANGDVTYSYKDSNTKQWKKLRKSSLAFLRLLKRHVLPKGFRRLREYGFLAPAAKKTMTRLRILTRSLMLVEPSPKKEPYQPKCPYCTGPMNLLLRDVYEDWARKAITRQEAEFPESARRQKECLKT